VLTNNRIENLSDLDLLSALKKLRTLSLVKNPVVRQKHYRLYVIHKIPTLRVLDFQKVKMREREEATRLFGGESGKALEAELSKKKSFIPGAAAAAGLTEEQKQKLKELLDKADAEEVQRIERLLASGKLPKEFTGQSETSTTTRTNTTRNMESNVVEVEDGLVEGASKGEDEAGDDDQHIQGSHTNGLEGNGQQEEVNPGKEGEREKSMDTS